MKDWEYADLQQYYKELTGNEGYQYQPGELCNKITEARMEKIKEFKEKAESAMLNISDQFNLQIIDDLRDRIITKIWEL